MSFRGSSSCVSWLCPHTKDRFDTKSSSKILFNGQRLEWMRMLARALSYLMGTGVSPVLCPSPSSSVCELVRDASIKYSIDKLAGQQYYIIKANT